MRITLQIHIDLLKIYILTEFSSECNQRKIHINSKVCSHFFFRRSARPLRNHLFSAAREGKVRLREVEWKTLFRFDWCENYPRCGGNISVECSCATVVDGERSERGREKQLLAEHKNRKHTELNEFIPDKMFHATSIEFSLRNQNGWFVAECLHQAQHLRFPLPIDCGKVSTR